MSIANSIMQWVTCSCTHTIHPHSAHQEEEERVQVLALGNPLTSSCRWGFGGDGGGDLTVAGRGSGGAARQGGGRLRLGGPSGGGVAMHMIREG
jgi:hypothetical protein